MNRGMIILTILVIVGLIIGAYRSSGQVREEKAKIAAINAEITALKDEIDLLKLEVAHLSADSTIEALARERLGMRLPDPDQIVRMRDSDIPMAGVE